MFGLPHDHVKKPALRLGGVLVLFVSVLLALIVFGLLAEDVSEKEAISFDRPLMLWLRSHASASMDLIMRGCTWLGSAALIVPVLLAVLWRVRHQRAAAVYLLAANIGAMLLNLAAKHGFARMRPDYWTPLVHVGSYSFPSGHAMQSMALACSLLLAGGIRRPAWMPALLAASYVFTVGLSRLYLGVHYPSDVLAGWCASFCWCMGLAFAMRRTAR